EGDDGGQHIAAVRGSLHRGCFGLQLRESAMNVDVDQVRNCDKTGPRCQRGTTTDASHVPRLRTTQHRGQRCITAGRMDRQIGGQEHRTARGAAAHECVRYRRLITDNSYGTVSHSAPLFVGTLTLDYLLTRLFT